MSASAKLAGHKESRKKKKPQDENIYGLPYYAVLHRTAVNKSSAVAEMGDRATIDIARKDGGSCVPNFSDSWDPV